MAPPPGIEQKKNTKKKKSGNNEEDKKNKKDTKMDRKLEVEKSEPKLSKKDKKRKLDSSSELNEKIDNDTINNTDKKQKKSKNEKKPKFNEEQKEEAFDERDRTITDSRFSSSQHDPMFRRRKQKDSKIEIDSRFSGMFEDRDFAGSSAPVDKRGKPKKDEKGKTLMSHYYLNQDSEKKIEEEEREEELERESDDDVSSSSDDESSSFDEDEDDDQNLGNYDISNYLMADHEDTPTIEKETHRLAIVNMDWDHIKAVDLYVVMTSCLPQGGRIESVTVYPSEFGMKCMEIEGSKGPGALMDLNNDNNNNNNNNNDEKNNDDGNVNNDDMSGDDIDDVSDEDDEDEENDVMGGDDDVSDGDDDDVSDEDDDESEEDEDEVNEKLRAYELNKLRYYYAVAVCDSSQTANHIYNTLDKTEFLDTSNVFDLRFVPDSMNFPNPPRDAAAEVPGGYKEPDFETRALQHSKVKLTWEDEKTDRKKVLRRNFNLDQLDELNIYLASSDSSEDEKESKKQSAREKFLSLLKPGNDFPGNEIPDSDEGEESEEEEEKEEEKGDMEITFNTDLEALSKKISERREKEETVWEAVLRKKREKKQALKMSRIKDNDESDFSDSGDEDDFFTEEKKGKGKKREKQREKDSDKAALEREREASRAELELLLAEEGERENEKKKKGYNMKKRLKEKRGKKGKKEKEESDSEEEKVPEVSAADDQRFEKMFSSHLFALDPTDPQYKRSAAYLRNKSNKKGEKSGDKEATQEEATADLNERVNDSKSKEKYERSAAIRSIKKKIQSHQSGFAKGS